MLLLRKILFYVFLLIYVIFCPLIIFYALGITFKPKTQTIHKTGLIHLTTLPPEASVYINNRAWAEKTPTTIRNLIPGEYYVRLSKRHYRSWARLLPVLEEKATSLENILLIPKRWRSQIVSLRRLEEINTFDRQPFLLAQPSRFIKDSLLLFFEEVNVLLTKRDIPKGLNDSAFLKPLPVPSDVSPQSRLKRSFSVPESRSLLLEIQDGKKLKYLWVDARVNELFAKNISEFFSEPPDKVLWDPAEEHLLFCLIDGFIHQIDTNAMVVRPQIIANVLDFTVFERRLYILTQNFILKRFASNLEEEPEVLLEDERLSRELFGKNEKWRMAVLSEDTLIFLSSRGALVTNHLPYRLAQRGIKDFRYDKNRQRLLVWTDQRLGIIDFNHSAKDAIFEKGPKLVWLTDRGKNIAEAFWANHGSHIIFQDHGKFFLFEAFPKFPGSKPHQLWEVETKQVAAYFEKGGLLFFLDPRTRRLLFVEIVPKQTETVPLSK